MTNIERFPVEETPQTGIEYLSGEEKAVRLLERVENFAPEVKEKIRRMRDAHEGLLEKYKIDPTNLRSVASGIAIRFLESLIENPEKLEQIRSQRA